MEASGIRAPTSAVAVYAAMGGVVVSMQKKCHLSPLGAKGCCADAVQQTCGNGNGAYNFAPCMLATTTTTGAPFEVKGKDISGAMEVKCDDPDKLMNNDVVKEAFRGAIAKSLFSEESAKSYVKITSITKSQSSSRRLSNGRRLTGTVEVAYNIEIPADSEQYSTFDKAVLVESATAKAITADVQKTLTEKNVDAKVEKVAAIGRPSEVINTFTTTTFTSTQFIYGKTFRASPVVCNFFFKGNWQEFISTTCLAAFKDSVAKAQGVGTDAVSNVQYRGPVLSAADLAKGVVGALNVTFDVGMSLTMQMNKELESGDILLQKDGSASADCCMSATRAKEASA